MTAFNIGKSLCNIGMRRTTHLTQFARRACFDFHRFANTQI